MQTTFMELTLSPVYRHAQRVLSQWIDARHAAARREAFRTRAAVAQLGPADRHRLARWLAWIVSAERCRGSRRLDERLRQLDASLHALMRTTLATLPPMSPADVVRLAVEPPVSADTAPRMTSVSATR
ncbi:hypothetical protein ATSB10_34040 [Dyella thiooxydans]|uniref:Uncharacterized protein n=1 Tax=Dyella thiooxydans TaxID=445710 RepID=A0A160N5B7_9GAMM|nr:hypothetical protein [Dyella thiooxydans]AND70858.1 hypothetical protein ATSB10_34040 [Dyella thiooxydans]